MKKYRTEYDSIGEKEIPCDAYYGVQTLRAYENFKISGKKTDKEMIRAIVEIKKAAAIVNAEAGVLEAEVANAIVQACDDILDGGFLKDFIVDAIQGGAGTSLNMNANEVIANRANELLGEEKGAYTKVHPNDHVNCGQSTNDAYPSAGKIAAIRMIQSASASLVKLKESLLKKSKEFQGVIKMGRTQLQDAVPVSFGQSFGAYASAISRDIHRFEKAVEALSILNMGGTAIGTGLNASPYYIENILPKLGEVTNLALTQAEDLIDATQNADCFVFVSGIVKSCATTLSKMASDLRLMSSGPRTGFAELNLPPKQNGSSIMPGKVNPVIPEVVNQIAFRIVGNDVTVTLAAEAGQLELNAFEPILFYSLFESLKILRNGVDTLRKECIEGLTVNTEACEDEVERSIGTITALCPKLGYARAAMIAKRALNEKRNIRDVLKEEGVLDSEGINELLNPQTMI